jgi:hypothetical protein
MAEGQPIAFTITFLTTFGARLIDHADSITDFRDMIWNATFGPHPASAKAWPVCTSVLRRLPKWHLSRTVQQRGATCCKPQSMRRSDPMTDATVTTLRPRPPRGRHAARI